MRGKNIIPVLIVKKKFAVNGDLKSHNKEAHEGKKTLKCDLCNSGFSQNVGFKSTRNQCIQLKLQKDWIKERNSE